MATDTMTGPPDPSESDNLDRIAAVENHATLYREQYQNQFLEDSMKEAQRETQTDNRGNPFIEVDNLRVTCVLAKPSSKRWAKGVKLYLRVQAYKGKGNALYQGAELPIKNQQVLLKLISAIAHLGAEHIERPKKRG